MLKNKHLTRALQACSDMGAWLLIIVVAIILTICTDTFFTWDNIMNVVRQTCVVSIIALGSSFVVLGGEIDLSTGMVSTLAGCTTALLITKAGFTFGGFRRCWLFRWCWSWAARSAPLWGF